MNFDLDVDERALVEGIRTVCARAFPDPARGFDREAWRALEEAGVFSLREIGLGMTQAVLVFEELGRALVPGPLVGTYLAGKPGAVVGVMERGDPFVEHLDVLDSLLIFDEKGLWEIPDMGSIKAEAVGDPLDPLTPLHRVLGLDRGDRVRAAEDAVSLRLSGAVLTAAYATGIASATLGRATSYAKERRQFGRAIGAFQAVKHICADMLVRAEVARAATYAAGCALDDPDAADRARAAAAAKLLACDAALHNAKACIQVYGGMGFTWEMDVHYFLKRAAVLSTWFGASGAHAEAVAACL